jgi:hypothetical protein
MRRILTSTLLASLAVAAAGCAAGAPTTATLKATPVADVPAAPKAARVVAPAAPSKPEVALDAAAAPVAATGDRPAPPTDEAAIPEAPAFDLGAEPRRMAAAGDAEAQSILDPWRPYGVGVVSKTATSVTLAWRTDLAARAIVYHGKTFGLSRRGYDGVYHVNEKAKTQQVTITGLSRFRSYTFVVVGLGELTMQFPSYPVQVRTHLF